MYTNTELYHWKYVKREKKNGKWVYTYDNGSTAKKNYQQAQNNLNTRNAQERSAWRRNLPGGGVENAAFNNWTRYEYGDTFRKKGVKAKLEKKVDDAWDNYKGSPEQKKEARQESLKRATNSIKNWAKDKLGYDEKQAMETAKVGATVRQYKTDDIIKENDDWLVDNPGHKDILGLVKWQNNYVKELAAEAEQAYKDAKKDFDKTPLGMLERAKDFMDSSEEAQEYDKAAGERISALQRYQATQKKYREVKRKVDSGEYFDKDNGNLSIYAPYEKEYKQALREYESAHKKFVKAKKEYESTPQYKTKEMSDRLKSGRKKVSEWFKTHRI